MPSGMQNHRVYNKLKHEQYSKKAFLESESLDQNIFASEKWKKKQYYDMNMYNY